MSLSINTVTLGGNLTRDPEMTPFAHGKCVARFGVAVNDRYKSSDGSWKETVTFVDVEVWNATAQVAEKYLRKGSPVVLEGKLKSDEWQTQAGEKRQKLLLKVERLHLIGSPREAPAVNVSSSGQSGGITAARVAMPVQGGEDEPPF